MSEKEVFGIFKLVLLGDSSVGKSNILNRLVHEIFNEDLNATIGIDFKNINLEIDKKEYTLQIWDTAGQERFKTMLSSYFQGSHGIILVYDITEKNSFLNLDSWLDVIKQTLDLNDLSIILVGNKKDLEENRQIPYEDGLKYAKDNGFLFIETSAKFNLELEINKCFELLTKELLNKYDYNPNKRNKTLTNTEKVVLNKEIKTTNKKNNCC